LTTATGRWLSVAAVFVVVVEDRDLKKAYGHKMHTTVHDDDINDDDDDDVFDTDSFIRSYSLDRFITKESKAPCVSTLRR
jgi:hypothetical protein